MTTRRKMPSKRNRSSFRYKREPRVTDLPRDLRGLSSNRYGGHQNNCLRSYGMRSSTHGPCYTYSEAQKRELERRMRAEGRL